jgi:S-DNA-T family DNA segregation ATPase FtsK/SpoIIIE
MMQVLSWMSFGLIKTAHIAGPAINAARQRSEVLSEIWQKLSTKNAPAAHPAGMDFTLDSQIETSIGKDYDNDADSKGDQADDNNPKPIKVTSQQPKKPEKQYIPKSYKDYTLPPLDLLEQPERGFADVQGRVVKAKAAALESLLEEFSINARVVAADTGPVVTMFELELGAGVKVSQISTLANDMARALSAGAVRVVAPLPGKHTIGIEVPNNEKERVRIKDIMQLAGKKSERMKLPLFLGKDSSGEGLVSDLTDMPHLLIAGTTGSGKSVCINSIISSMLLTKRPDEVKMILVDPKMVEMTAFNTVPHLMSPIVTETKRAVQILEWATVKMDERYSLLAEARVKNIAGYNKLSAEEIVERFNPSTSDEEAQIPKKLPYLVIIIDELADLMMTAAKEIEAYIVRLAQKSRAVGIHLVLATQRPQATVVTGLIKSNMPCRIGFRVAARMDSRIILDQNGAEALLGQGDMLFLKPGTSDLIRAQGTFLDEMEVKRIVKHLKEIAEPQFHPELTQLGRIDPADMPRDELFDDAVRIVLESKRGSVSLLQRRLSIGYARASRIIETMASLGILGEYKGSQAREVMYTLDEYEQMMAQGVDADAQDDQKQQENDYEEATAYIDEDDEFEDEYDDEDEDEDDEEYEDEEDEQQDEDDEIEFTNQGMQEYAALEDDE